MDNLLTQIDGVLISALLVGAVIGWFVCWLFKHKQFAQHLASTESELEAKKAQVDALKHDLQRRDESLQEQNARSSKLSSEVLSLQGQLESRHKDFNDLSAKIELLETSQSESSEEIDTLEDTIASLEEKIATHSQAQHTEREKLARAKQIEDELREKLAASEMVVTTTQNQLTEVTAQWQQASNTIASLEQRNAKPLNQAHTTQEIGQLKDRLAELTQNRESLAGDISSLESSLSVWQQRASRTSADLAGAQKKIASLEQALAESNNSEPSYERLLTLKDQEIAEQKQRTRATQSKLLAVNEEIHLRDQQILALHKTIDKLQTNERRELATLSKQLETAKLQHTTEKNTHERQIAELTKQHEQTVIQLNNLQRQLREADAAANSLQAQKEKLSGELNERKIHLAQAQQNYTVTLHEQQRLNAQVMRLENENQQQRQQLERTLREIQAKTHANDSLRVALNNQTQLNEKLQHSQVQISVPQEESAEDTSSPPKALMAKKPAHIDDLKQIKGVGPKLEKMLHKLGIYQFAQIATFDRQDSAWVDEHIESFKGRIYRDQWVKQAKKLSR